MWKRNRAGDSYRYGRRMSRGCERGIGVRKEGVMLARGLLRQSDRNLDCVMI